ncbi:MAG TPA: hypothetical protein VEL74_12785 [Thermoanaerobaculia bacterium]|nr:hypothetical protein [Thermoanaerobaculia bacterium]
MKRTLRGKMTLSKETIRLLGEPEELVALRHVAGAATGDTTPCPKYTFCGVVSGETVRFCS